MFRKNNQQDTPPNLFFPYTRFEHNSIAWHGGLYAVPIEVMERYKVQAENSTDFISIDDLFGDFLMEGSGETGVLLKGLRYREGLSQIEFAKKLSISQTNLSVMENSRRAIRKEIAKRIADIFGLDYRLFL